ncbi:hypothetical protein OV090_42785 [Nannocystis sp. RBIL2]|uniref:hypothetical protein n=1 Tax=Nannocystis sp. RBIL2 TaxID=2996788 RepID=UPI00226DF1CB|nr:hypothetical protein [Nannocystis sp. RBIL2]MCY1071547.1 hypothetical protein [Nannocystis sp. RBIL2]
MVVSSAGSPNFLWFAGALLTASVGCPGQGDLGVYTDTDVQQSGSGSSSGSTAGGSSPSTGSPDDAPSTGVSTVGSTGEPVTTESTTASESTGLATTSEDGTTGDTTGDGSATGGDPPLQCLEPDPSLLSYPVVYFDPWPGGDALDQEFDGDCTLIDVTEDLKLHFTLDCASATAMIDLAVAPEDFGVALQLDQSYRLRWVARAQPWASDWWFTLSTVEPAPTLLLAGMETQELLPAGMPDFFAPLTLAHDGSECGQATDCDDPWDPLLVEMSQGGPTVPVTHKTRTDVGDYRVVVNLAGRFRDLHTMARECLEWTDPVPQAFNMMMIHRGD